MPVHWIVERGVGIASTPLDEVEVEEWFESGVRAVVSLLNEADLPATWDSLEHLTRFLSGKFEVYSYPVMSKRAPPVTEALKIVKWIDKKLSEGKPVLVVCGRGWGRGASLIASYLVYKGFNPEESVKRVVEEAEKANAEPMDSEEQRALPYRLAEELRRLRSSS